MKLTLNNRPVTARAIALELEKAEQDALDNALLAVVERLEKLIANLNRRSTRRTRLGNFSRVAAGAYDQPMKNARVTVERVGTKVIVYVDDYVFNLLDRGRDPVSAKGRKKLRFPVYSGKLTRPNSATLFRSRVKTSPLWVTKRIVAGFEPRNFYANLLKELKVKHRKKTSIFVFPEDSSVIEFKIERRN